MVDVMGRQFKPYDPERGEEWEGGSMSLPYRVYVRSEPGHYEQYNGFVEVFAYDCIDATEKALVKLRTTSFPDRHAGMWKVEAVTCMGKELTL